MPQRFFFTIGLCFARVLEIEPFTHLNSIPKFTIRRVFKDHPYLFRTLDEGSNAVSFSNRYNLPELIITVSSIPLMATFTTADVVVANSEAKAILRAVAAEAVRRVPRASYFPAHEIAVNSEPAQSWIEDALHIQRPLAKHIVATFIQTLESEVPFATPAVRS